MKKILYALILFTLPCFAQQVQENNNRFALELYKWIHKNEPANIVFSSFSIYSNLAIAYAGARGETAKSIDSILQAPTPPEVLYNQTKEWIERLITVPRNGGYSLQVANGVFIDKNTPLLPAFQQIAFSDFNASVQSIDFGVPVDALKNINEWFSKQTNGKISSLLEKSNITNITRLVLASAIYFEGEWTNPFDKRQTKMAPFHTSSTETVQVPMMEQTSILPYFETDIAKGIWLPIQLGQESQAAPAVVILVPNEGVSFENLVMSFDIDAPSHWMVSSHQKAVHLQLPKFCITQKLSLRPFLEKMGMTLPFTTKADFSGISGRKDLMLNSIEHGAYISVNETGVTASAGTAAIMGLKTAPIKEIPIEFKIDKPFLFFIVDMHAEAILFMGKLSKPDLAVCP